MDMDSCRKTKMKDPNSEKGDAEETKYTYVEGQNQRTTPVNHEDYYRCQWHNETIDWSWGEG